MKRATDLRSPQFWLAEVDQHGNPRLVDGSHATRQGVEQAAYLYANLGMGKGKSYACAEVVLTPVDAVAHDVNEEAVAILSRAVA